MPKETKQNDVRATLEWLEKLTDQVENTVETAVLDRSDRALRTSQNGEERSNGEDEGDQPSEAKKDSPPE